MPAFFVAVQFVEAFQHLFYDLLVPNALITYGPESEAVYETLKKRQTCLKVLRLLSQTAP